MICPWPETKLKPPAVGVTAFPTLRLMETLCAPAVAVTRTGPVAVPAVKYVTAYPEGRVVAVVEDSVPSGLLVVNVTGIPLIGSPVVFSTRTTRGADVPLVVTVCPPPYWISVTGRTPVTAGRV